MQTPPSGGVFVCAWRAFRLRAWAAFGANGQKAGGDTQLLFALNATRSVEAEVEGCRWP